MRSAPKILAAAFSASRAGPFVGQEVAHVDDGVVEVVAEDCRPKMFDEDAADRAAAIEDPAVVAGAGPELVALFGVVEQGAEERGLEGGGVVAQAAGQIQGHEGGGLFGEEDGAVGVVQDFDRNVLEALAAEHEHDRHLEAALADQRDEPGRLAEDALLAPVDDHAADGGVGLDGEFGVIGAAGDEDAEAEALGLADDLLEAKPVEIGVVERRSADEELEVTLVFHRYPGAAWRRGGSSRAGSSPAMTNSSEAEKKDVEGADHRVVLVGQAGDDVCEFAERNAGDGLSEKDVGCAADGQHRVEVGDGARGGVGREERDDGAGA